jgi:hypothetical protein
VYGRNIFEFSKDIGDQIGFYNNSYESKIIKMFKQNYCENLVVNNIKRHKFNFLKDIYLDVNIIYFNKSIF